MEEAGAALAVVPQMTSHSEIGVIVREISSARSMLKESTNRGVRVPKESERRLR